MRYGIMAIQPENMMQPGASTRELVANFLRFDHSQLVREVSKHGFNLVELSGDLGMLHPPAFAEAAIEKLAKVKDRLGLSYTVHLPFHSVDLSTPLNEVREASAHTIVEAIRITSPLEPEVYVCHATAGLAAEFHEMNISEKARPHLLGNFKSKALASIDTILTETRLPSRQFAVENISFPFDLTLDIAEEFDLGFCLDVGHLLAGYSGPFDLFDALEACLPRLAEVHLHDSPWQGPNYIVQKGKDHQPLGTGDLDVGRLLDRLELAGWDGPIIFELRIDEALKSLEVIRRVEQTHPVFEITWKPA